MHPAFVILVNRKIKHPCVTKYNVKNNINIYISICILIKNRYLRTEVSTKYNYLEYMSSNIDQGTQSQHKICIYLVIQGALYNTLLPIEVIAQNALHYWIVCLYSRK